MGQVFWVQIALSFVLWIGLGAAMGRNSSRIRAHSFATPSRGRALRSAGLLAASPFGIFVPLSIVWSAGGIRPSGLLLWAWGLITLGGFACVLCATLGLAYAVSLAMESAVRSRVTTPEAPASSNEDRSLI